MFGVVIQGMVVGVALAAPIGPINIEIVRRGLLGGFRHGWLVGLGAVTADTFYCALIIGGVTPVADHPALRGPLYLAGAVVLSYLGLMSLRGALRGGSVQSDSPVGRQSYAAGFLMAATNPMGIVYWLSIGAALVASAVERSGRSAAPVLVVGVFVGILVWVTFLSTLAQGGRRFVSDQTLRWLTAGGGAVLIGFGGWFAWNALRTLFA